MPAVHHRRDAVFPVLNGNLVRGVGYSVSVYSPGGTVTSAVGTTINLLPGHAFKAGQKFITSDGLTFSGSASVSSATATSIVMSSGTWTSLAANTILANLGADTGTSTPNYNGSPINIYSTMDGSGTAVTNSVVTTNSDGEYEYWTDAGEVWEIVRTGTTIFDIVRGVILSIGSRTVDVTKFGAKGDGTTDDYGAIQAAVNYAKTLGYSGNLGGTVYFPGGRYLVSAPIVLPRTTSVPTNVVHLKGDGLDRSIIAGNSATFSAGQGVIQWDNTSAVPIAFQSISDLCIVPANVLGTYAIYLKVSGTPASGSDVRNQRFSGSFRRILMFGSNQYHTALMKLEGDIFESDFVDIYGDPITGSWVADTVVIQTDTSIFADAIFTENSGLNFCSVRNLYGGFRSGGFSATFQGRMNKCQVSNVVAGIGARNTSALLLTNSFGSTLSDLSSEGAGKPQIKLSSCRECELRSVAIGAPSNGGSGFGNGIEFVSSSRNFIYGRGTVSGVPSFSASAVKAITLDASSTFNKIREFGLNAALASEITDSGSSNYIETFNTTSSTYESSGYALQHDFVINGDLDATGGYRQCLDLWYQDNVAAGQTLIDLTRDPGGTTIHTNHWIGVRAGSVTAVGVFSSEARTAGTLTIEVYRNGGVATGLTAVLDGTNTTQKVTTAAKGSIVFGAQDRLIAKITTTAGWTPTTADIRVAIEVET